ncbi:MAG: acetyl-CoA synthetase [Candidatus Eremiobacteraeota bacterium]|nr:acetyl-CoA synthetase [Candidatus Eremiobacteraeota bacterium]
METTSSYIEGLLSTGEVIPPPPGVAEWFRIADQDAFVAESLRDPIAFWRERAGDIAWDTAPKTVFTGALDDPHWFPDGRLNATVSCLDRHMTRHGDALAYQYVCENGDERTISYADLLARVNQLANALRLDGVRVGDRVIIYMPLTIEGIVAMLACARIGAIHSVVYAGLGATSLRDRIVDAGAQVVIVGDVTYRRGKPVVLKTIVDDAVRGLDLVRRIVVHRREASAEPVDSREVNFEAYCDHQSPECDPEIVGAEHPLFILYTSGTTGKPKGVVMTHGGYLVGSAAMLTLTTGITPDDAYWCTSDIGWIVGHTMMVYGALANRYRCILREGSADYPTPDAVYEIIERYKVTKFYTAPTLARMLLRLGADLATKHDLSSLQAVYCAGEPLNPEAWRFLYEAIGRGNVAVCNEWWQTELAAPTLGFFPTAAIRPDRSGKALGPVAFSIRDANGAVLPPNQGGLLVVETPLPYMFATVWNDPERFAQYFRWGVYVAGDVATIDEQGYVTVRGRADDVLNIAGHRIATADVESALVSHKACGEAGVCGVPDEIKGEAIVAYVVLRSGYTQSDELAAEFIAHVRHELGPIATPSAIRFSGKLPKTRSGKIMRRLLKAQETGQDLGDVTTLEE